MTIAVKPVKLSIASLYNNKYRYFFLFSPFLLKDSNPQFNLLNDPKNNDFGKSKYFDKMANELFH